MEGFRYFVVLHMGQQASSMVTSGQGDLPLQENGKNTLARTVSSLVSRSSNWRVARTTCVTQGLQDPSQVENVGKPSRPMAGPSRSRAKVG